jgi:hypothetical protein
MASESGTSLSRALRCPECLQQVETMRRFRLACPECGHEWAEESRVPFGERALDYAKTVAEWVALVGGVFLIAMVVLAGLGAIESLTVIAGACILILLCAWLH